MSQDNIVGLADAIEALRAALTQAIDQGRDQDMQFRIEPIEVTLEAVMTKDANGKIGWGTLGLGGRIESANTQTLKLKLRPVLKGRDDELIEDFTVADQVESPQHIGLVQQDHVTQRD